MTVPPRSRRRPRPASSARPPAPRGTGRGSPSASPRSANNGVRPRQTGRMALSPPRLRGTHPIGQGYSVNGVQMASVYASVANGGVRVQPTLLKATADDSGSMERAKAPKASRVLSQKVADQLRGMLEGVTNEGGTAETAAIAGYRVAGKTGTAQRAVNGGYSGYTASFVGFAPQTFLGWSSPCRSRTRATATTEGRWPDLCSGTS